MKYVSKPPETTVNHRGKKHIPVLHYASAGNLMVSASVDMEAIRVQQAEEFVKRLHQEKAKFEKKNQAIEEEIKRREGIEFEQLLVLERKAELERLNEKKRKLEESLKAIKERNEERLKAKEEWEKFAKDHKGEKPLYRQLEERYYQKHVIPVIEEKKQKLKEIRDLHRPIRRDDLLDHEKKLQKQMEEVQAKKPVPQPIQTQSLPLNALMVELFKQEKKAKIEQIDEKKKLREKLEEFKLRIKKQKVAVDPAKEEEMKSLIEKLNEQAKSKRSTKGDDPERLPDENELLMQRTKKLQNLVIAKSMRKYETMEKEIEAKRAMASSPLPHYPDYLREMKKKLRLQSHLDDWKQIVAEKDLGIKEKTDAIMVHVGRLEEKAKMKEQMMRVRQNKTEESQKYSREEEEIDSCYISAIKAKLSILNDDSVPIDLRKKKIRNRSVSTLKGEKSIPIRGFSERKSILESKSIHENVTPIKLSNGYLSGEKESPVLKAKRDNSLILVTEPRNLMSDMLDSKDHPTNLGEKEADKLDNGQRLTVPKSFKLDEESHKDFGENNKVIQLDQREETHLITEDQQKGDQIQEDDDIVY